jgi:hypothetical protein
LDWACVGADGFAEVMEVDDVQEVVVVNVVVVVIVSAALDLFP